MNDQFVDGVAGALVDGAEGAVLPVASPGIAPLLLLVVFGVAAGVSTVLLSLPAEDEAPVLPLDPLSRRDER